MAFISPVIDWVEGLLLVKVVKTTAFFFRGDVRDVFGCRIFKGLPVDSFEEGMAFYFVNSIGPQPVVRIAEQSGENVCGRR